MLKQKQTILKTFSVHPKEDQTFLRIRYFIQNPIFLNLDSILHEGVKIHHESLKNYLKTNELELAFINKTNNEAFCYHIKSELEHLRIIFYRKGFYYLELKISLKKCKVFLVYLKRVLQPLITLET